MKVLSIGNSFSDDAHRYLHEVASNDGFDLQTLNLCVGGCSLETHYKNLCEDLSEYEFVSNGITTPKKISISQALASDKWDIITVQQVSHLSTKYETYTPYLSELVVYLRKACPNAKIYIHETWPYENGCERMKTLLGYESSKEMFADIKSCCERAVKEIDLDGIIHSGTAMMKAVDYGMKIHRDTYHAKFGIGRYLLALVWYKTLTGRDITNNNFDKFDEETSLEDCKKVIEIVNAVIK